MDAHSIYQKERFTFDHYLLSVTGRFTTQPYIDDEIVMVYNGEIYNQDYDKSDGDVILPLYKKYGIEFAKHLDGEFAIAIYDFKTRAIIYAVDVFASKPLWVNGDECCSYESGVGGHKVRANTVIKIHMESGHMIERTTSHNFDFGNQHKTSYDDWVVAFKNAVAKRAKQNCFLGLSSGYDSGAIACELNNLGIDYKAYTIIGKENQDILKQRITLTENHTLLENINPAELLSELHDQVEPFNYRIRYQGGKGKINDLHGDQASIGLLAISKLANSEGRIVYMSGQGADEIMSDYSPLSSISELNGNYPVDLKPWINFSYGCQYSYLGKEEYVPGSLNIECRYPFLDKDVVQEFLWLSTELKNREYKAPLYEYLTREEYPFCRGEKFGFDIDK